MIPDVVGRPLIEAEQVLKAADVKYSLVRALPTRHFFKTDYACLYVVRQKQTDKNCLVLTICASIRKEVP